MLITEKGGTTSWGACIKQRWSSLTSESALGNAHFSLLPQGEVKISVIELPSNQNADTT